MMRVELSEDAQLDLAEIADYIAADNPRRAVSFIRELIAEIRNIGDGPLHYQLRPEIGADARLSVVGNYVILFWIGSDAVYIERVVHGSRDLSVAYQ